MKTPNDFREWANGLLQELYYTPNDQRVSLLETHLKRASGMGWAIEQDKDLNAKKTD